MTNENKIHNLCAWAARLGAMIVSVHELPGAGMAQAQTPNFCTLTLPEFNSCLSADEKRVLCAHVKNGGEVILLDREAANDFHTLAHELGRVATFLADCDCDYRKPAPKLATLARRCGFDEHYRKSNDELMAECVHGGYWNCPLCPPLHDFCQAAFVAFVRHGGCKSRYTMTHSADP